MKEERMIESVINGLQSDYTCQKCGHVQKATILPCINFSKNPEYYARVMNLDIFKVKCEKCGKETLIKFDTLVIDETHNYFIYLLSDKSLYDRFKYQVTYFVETTLNKDDKYDLDKFKTRLVLSPNDLIEKMNIFEIGLNDEAIELIKIGLADKGIVDSKVLDTIYFDGMKNPDLEFVALSSKSSTVSPVKLTVKYEFYNRLLDDLKGGKNADESYFELVDEESTRAKFKFNGESMPEDEKPEDSGTSEG